MITANGSALLGVVLWAPDARAYPLYDDPGSSNDCHSCHPGFSGGGGNSLHANHTANFGITACKLCHPAGGGSKPVRTYTSGTGGGLGCAGCHGQDFGETSPNSLQPKSTAYGLRLFHVAQGITSCGTGGCHQPGALGHSNPFPLPLGEAVAPTYYSLNNNNLGARARAGRKTCRSTSIWWVSTRTATGLSPWRMPTASGG